MKCFALAGIALLLSGCAATSTTNQTPHFLPTQKTAVAPGYPFERVSPPGAFSLSDNLRNSDRRSSDMAGDASQIEIGQYAFNWASDDQKLLSVWHIGARPGTELFPLSDSDGYEFVGSQRVSYWSGWGRYNEMTPETATPVTPTPECVSAVQIGATSNNKRYRSIASLYEPIACEKGPMISQGDYAAQRQRLYRLIGLQ